MITIGVLALQGAFSKHAEAMRAVGAQVIEVRTPQQLDRCNGLIIPGGESTTITRQMAFIGLEDPLKEFAASKPVFGTCAGLILMSTEVISNDVKSFGLLDIAVRRNAYGRQVDSFVAPVAVAFPDRSTVQVDATFIRAPRIEKCGRDVQVLASYEGSPILVQQGRHLGAAYHPELSDNLDVHAYFLRRC